MESQSSDGTFSQSQSHADSWWTQPQRFVEGTGRGRVPAPGDMRSAARRWVMPALTAARATGCACVWRGLRAGGLISEALEDCG